MKKVITLFCAMGMSTSLMVSRMKEEAEKQNFECEIEAYPYSDSPKLAPLADVIFLGPQVRFYLKELQGKYPDKIIETIDMKIYGRYDGAALMKRALELIGEEHE